MKRIIVGQRSKVYQSFWEPKTMLQVSQETGCKVKNICWYVRAYRIAGAIFPLGRDKVDPTQRMAMRYTTNPTRAWSYYVEFTRPEWDSLSNEAIMELWRIIRRYVLNGFDQAGLYVPGDLSDLWSKRVKALIDRRARG